ncbi:MAG: acetylornithine transaminase [Clostridia bacterium]|nr:acetylornithine transaminase [Clostridia bacterium]
MNTDEVIALTQKYVMKTYNRLPIAFVRGEGCRLWDADGREYLDFMTGLAVNSLGQCHPAVVRAISEQAATLMHVSNVFHIEQQARLAQLLVENATGSGLSKVFFCNSGAEANEAAIKLARKYSRSKYGKGRYEIITAERSFHGRTLATVTATGQQKYQSGFEPLPEGFRYVPYDDLAAVQGAISAKTCAIMIEAIQGEGGVYPASEEYMQGLAELCRERGLLLILDEVQTGMGRTGRFYAYQNFAGVRPDIITLAKALGGGIAIGAMMATDEAASGFEPGNHASTFGGNPVACAAGIAVVETMLKEGIPEHAGEMGAYLGESLRRMARRHWCVSDVRGLGLMVGVELTIDANEVTRIARERGLIANCIAGKVIRLLPPLIVGRSEIDEAVRIIDTAISQVEAEASCVPMGRA